jgi:hypothetical protein
MHALRLKCTCGHVGLISRRPFRRVVVCIKCGCWVPIEPKLKAKFSRPWSEPTPTVYGFSRPTTNAEYQNPPAPAITDEESP